MKHEVFSHEGVAGLSYCVSHGDRLRYLIYAHRPENRLGSFNWVYFHPKAHGLCFNIQFLCKSGQCLNGKNERVCDGSANCAGGDDESRCGKGTVSVTVKDSDSYIGRA